MSLNILIEQLHSLGTYMYTLIEGYNGRSMHGRIHRATPGKDFCETKYYFDLRYPLI